MDPNSGGNAPAVPVSSTTSKRPTHPHVPKSHKTHTQHINITTSTSHTQLQVYMHLFSDALTISTRYLNGTYQLRRVVNLRECQVCIYYIFAFI